MGLILLDMDGVVSDAHGGFLVVLGHPELREPGRYPAGVYSIAEVLGVSDEVMWREIDRLGSEFWRNLDEYPWARYLYKELRQVGRVVFLSSPSYDPGCLKGKLEWLHRLTGDKEFRDYIFTTEKDLLAAPGRILIDDSPENCKKFTKSGGRAIQFPAHWNGKETREIVEEIPSIVDKVRSAMCVSGVQSMLRGN